MYFHAKVECLVYEVKSVSREKGVKFQSFKSHNLPNILSLRITLTNAV